MNKKIIYKPTPQELKAAAEFLAKMIAYWNRP